MDVPAMTRYYSAISMESLIEEVGDHYKRVYYYLRDEHPDTDPNDLLVSAILTAVASDGKLSDAEVEFIVRFVGDYSYEQIYRAAGNYFSEEAQSLLERLYDHLTPYYQEEFLNVCLGVLCVDKRVTYHEECFFNRLLNR